MSELKEVIFVILDRTGKRLWGTDGWITPPGEAILYDTAEEAWAEARQLGVGCKVFEYKMRKQA